LDVKKLDIHSPVECIGRTVIIQMSLKSKGEKDFSDCHLECKKRNIWEVPASLAQGIVLECDKNGISIGQRQRL